MSREGVPPLSETVGDRIEVRGRDLADELIGKVSFTEMLLLDLHGAKQSPAHVRLVDAVLVALMEHGITPSTLAARIVLDGAPESIQGAVAAGLLATGSRFLGVIEEAAVLIQNVLAEEPVEESARVRVRELVAAGQRVPGFGHNLHTREDPRVEALVALAREEGVAGPHVASLDALRNAVEAETGRALIPNAAGAVAAILSDLGYEADDIRGFALVARSAGLVAHVADERRNPVARAVWEDFHGNKA
jgi:citrate synthase